jgi:hypothetical protein
MLSLSQDVYAENVLCRQYADDNSMFGTVPSGG